MDKDLFDNFSVLILEESSTLQDLLSDWISGVTTKTVSSTESIPTEFDSTVTVACLSQPMLGNDADAVQKFILKQNPFCQIVGVIPRSAFIGPFEDEFDEVLQRPLFRNEFQQTIEYRFVSGIYSNLLSELYDINTSLVAIRRASEDEIEEKNESLDKIENRREQVQSQLKPLQERLSSDTLFEIIQTKDRHRRYLLKPESEKVGRGTKFRSRRCPACHLPWGVDHRNDLGNGYNRLGADVYQCGRCHKIVHGLAGEQRVL